MGFRPSRKWSSPWTASVDEIAWSKGQRPLVITDERGAMLACETPRSISRYERRAALAASVPSPTFSGVKPDRVLHRPWAMPNTTLLSAPHSRSIASVAAERTINGVAEFGNSVVLGRQTMSHAKLVNNVFLFQGAPYLEFLPDPACPTVAWACPASVLATDEVRNNVFEITGLEVLATTRWTSLPGQNPIDANTLNNAFSWFGAWTPVGGNQAAVSIGFAGPVEIAPAPTYAFRFRPSTTSVLLSAGTNQMPGWLANETYLFGQNLRTVFGPPNAGAYAGAGF